MMNRFCVMVFLLALFGHGHAMADGYVEIVAASATVRATASQKGDLVAKVNRGQVFEHVRTSGDWRTIFMFSGEYRYIQVSQSKVVQSAPELKDLGTKMKGICKALFAATDRASSEAIARSGDNIDREVAMQNLLMDRYITPIFNQHRIPGVRSDRVNLLCANQYLGR